MKSYRMDASFTVAILEGDPNALPQLRTGYKYVYGERAAYALAFRAASAPGPVPAFD